MNTSKAVTAIMDKKDLSAVELSEAMNVSRQTIYNWKKGDNEPSVNDLRKMAEHCNITFTYLVFLGKEA